MVGSISKNSSLLFYLKYKIPTQQKSENFEVELELYDFSKKKYRRTVFLFVRTKSLFSSMHKKDVGVDYQKSIILEPDYKRRNANLCRNKKDVFSKTFIFGLLQKSTIFVRLEGSKSVSAKIQPAFEDWNSYCCQKKDGKVELKNEEMEGGTLYLLTVSAEKRIAKLKIWSDIKIGMLNPDQIFSTYPKMGNLGKMGNILPQKMSCSRGQRKFVDFSITIIILNFC
ncbi:hypothetical protein MHBO_000902 [Bonamia ostreae]|uniref:Uncharacterized protein n=1 Tax=Bonamia ostreae TaxID=126728 RepID=A0ABV2AH69_9EUKA